MRNIIVTKNVHPSIAKRFTRRKMRTPYLPKKFARRKVYGQEAAILDFERAKWKNLERFTNLRVILAQGPC